MLGVLPFFHSFGFTGDAVAAALHRLRRGYHPNPTDAKTIGELAAKYRATILISTPTFCTAYIRKVQPEQFAHLRLAVVGAERLRDPIAVAFKDKFGVDLLEGYGCTEMAPVVAVNTDERAAAARGAVRSAVRCPASRRWSSIPTPAPARSSTRKGCCSSGDRTRCSVTWARRN